MGLTLIITTLLISLIITSISESSWYSYVLFLVFLGGILVLFIYVTTLASNEIFKLRRGHIILYSSILIIILFLFFLDPQVIPIQLTTRESIICFVMKQEITPANQLYNSNYSIIIILASYLFITLIAVVKITDISKGPLRCLKTYVNTNTITPPFN